MKTKSLFPIVTVLLAFSTLIYQPATASAQGTGFTYQGRLTDGTNPASGIYDLRFAIYDSSGGATQIGGTLTNSTAVSNGLFTVTLDFGAGVFTGADRWLYIAARTNGGGAFAPLTPRQQITATPYASYAGGADAGGITGILPSGSLAGGYFNAVQFQDPGNQFIGSFTGDGTGLFNVSATTLNGKTDADFWQLAGNAGTTSADFIGTTDYQPLELRVFNERALLIEPRPLTANLVGGNAANVTAPGVVGPIIAGGGQPSAPNQAVGEFSVIAGGFGNLVARESVVGGGVSKHEDRNWRMGGGKREASGSAAALRRFATTIIYEAPTKAPEGWRSPRPGGSG